MSSTSRSSKKEDPSQYDQSLDEVHNHIKEVFDILKRETNNLRQEREAFDEVAKKLEHVHFSKTLKLNVGGQLFSTSLETMKRDPGTCVFALNNYMYVLVTGQKSSTSTTRTNVVYLRVLFSTRFHVTRHVFRKI